MRPNIEQMTQIKFMTINEHYPDRPHQNVRHNWRRDIKNIRTTRLEWAYYILNSMNLGVVRFSCSHRNPVHCCTMYMYVYKLNA